MLENTKKWNPLLLLMLMTYLIAFAYTMVPTQLIEKQTQCNSIENAEEASSIINPNLNYEIPSSEKISFQVKLEIGESIFITSSASELQIGSQNRTFGVILSFVIMIGMAKVVRSKNITTEGSLRDLIYQKIQEMPGIHFRELCRELDKKNGVIQYHLRILESTQNQIESHQDGAYHRYFPKEMNKNSSMISKKVVSMMQRPSMNEILRIFLASKKPLTRETIAEKRGITPQGVSYICGKLEMEGIIKKNVCSNHNFYELTNQARHILNLCNL